MWITPPEFPQNKKRSKWKRRSAMRKSQAISLKSVYCLVLHYTPNDINHLSAQTNQCLRLWLTLGHFSLEICFGFFVTTSWDLRQSHAMKSAIQSSVTTSCFHVSVFLSTRAFSRRATGIFSQCSRRMKAIDVSNFSDNHSGDDCAASRSGLNGVILIKQYFHFFF